MKEDGEMRQQYEGERDDFHFGIWTPLDAQHSFTSRKLAYQSLEFSHKSIEILNWYYILQRVLMI